LLDNPCDIHEHINVEVLKSVNISPLVSGRNYGVMKLIAISRILEKRAVLYIDTEKSILCLDEPRQ
jgi:hypothetical protein